MIKLVDILREVEEKPQTTIYCDLDGVLANFEKGYKDLTGSDAPDYNSDYDEEAFWKPITDAGISFWTNLEWMPDAEALWDYIKPYSPQILTAPSRDMSSRKGKVMWVRDRIGNPPIHFRQAKFKQDFSEPGAILIDDRLDTCQRWKDAGGIAINHKNVSATIQILKDLGL